MPLQIMYMIHTDCCTKKLPQPMKGNKDLPDVHWCDAAAPSATVTQLAQDEADRGGQRSRARVLFCYAA